MRRVRQRSLWVLHQVYKAITRDLLIFFGFCGLSAGIARAAPPIVSDDAKPHRDLFKAQATEVYVDLTITGRRGKPAQGIKIQDLVALDNGFPQRITSLSETSIPQDIVLLLDVGTCMEKWPYLMYQATGYLTRALPPSDRIAVVGFAARPHVETLLSSNPEVIRMGIERAFEDPVVGSAERIHIFRAVEYAARFFDYMDRKEKSGLDRTQHSIVVVTANRSLHSSVTKSQVLQHLYANNTSVFALIVPDDPRNPFYFNNRPDGGDSILDVAAHSGGSAQLFYYPGIIERLFSVIGSRYRLSYAAPIEIAGQYHSIQIVLSETGQQRFKGAKITAREGYLPH